MMNFFLLSFCFNVKYFQENIFTFYHICFAVKYLVKSKKFYSTKPIKANLCKMFYTWNIIKIFYNYCTLSFLIPLHLSHSHAVTLSQSPFHNPTHHLAFLSHKKTTKTLITGHNLIVNTNHHWPHLHRGQLNTLILRFELHEFFSLFSTSTNFTSIVSTSTFNSSPTGLDLVFIFCYVGLLIWIF